MSSVGRRLVVGSAAMSILVAGSLVGRAAGSSPVVFVVNSTADRGDAMLNGVCQTSVQGECTLRAAIQEADATAGAVTINFAISGSGIQRISPQTVLPSINNGKYGIAIDGFTQPGSAVNTDPLADNAKRMIELVGLGPTSISGLVITGQRNVVRGLDIHSFGTAVLLTGTGAGRNVIEGDLIGLMPDGSLVADYRHVSQAPCVDLINGPYSNHVGLPGDANRNVISGCYEKGVTLNNQHTGTNFVQNNIIGLDPTGTQRRANQQHGVDINWATNGTLIGGTGFEEHNVISGNVNDGVEISHGVGTVNNKVIGNYIGTDVTGNVATAATRNDQIGINLPGKPDCNNKPCPPDEGFETVTDNVVVNTGFGGILIHKGVHDTVVARNRVGVTLNGTLSRTGQFGIMLAAGVTHITVGPGNEIAGSPQGIQITSLGVSPVSTVPSPTQYNTITQNSIHDIGIAIGIDFLPYGQVNQNGNGDPNINQGVDVPVLSVSGAQVNAQTCASCTVELFASNGSIGSFGPGVTYLLTAVADSAGHASFSAPGGGWPPVVTATTTTTPGSSSEYAQNIVP